MGHRLVSACGYSRNVHTIQCIINMSLLIWINWIINLNQLEDTNPSKLGLPKIKHDQKYKYNTKSVLHYLPADNPGKVFMPGFLYLETSLLLFATLRHEPTFRATQNKQSFPGFSVSKQHLRLLLSSVSARQQATDSGETFLTHPHTHTLSPLHALWAWETWAQTKQSDCTVLLTVLFLWAKRQVGFEGKTNVFTVLLAFSPHFLKEIVFWVVRCLCLLPAEQQAHMMASWRSKQEKQPHSALLWVLWPPLISL